MCGTTMNKIFLVIINVIFVIAGAILTGLGALAKFKQDVLLKLFNFLPASILADVTEQWDIPTFLDEAAVVILVVGVILLVIGFCGFYGGLKKIKCLLVVYMVILGVILLAQIAAVILIYTKTDEVETEVLNQLTKSIDEGYTDSNGGVAVDDGNIKIGTDLVKLAWDGVQIWLSCCGVRNYTDYTFRGNYSFGQMSVQDAIVPLSCCNFLDKDAYLNIVNNPNDTDLSMGDAKGALKCLEHADPRFIHNEGCYTSFRQFVEHYWTTFAGILAAIVAVELIGFFSACCIVKDSDSKE